MPDSPYQSVEFFQQLLRKAVASNASDVHLKVGQPPGVRVDGEIRYFKTDRLMPDDVEALVRIILGDGADAGSMERLLEYDTSYTMAGLGRFRVNIYRQRGCFSIVMRSVPIKVPAFADLDLPPAIHELARCERGLVLVVGAAGNGKSTTLAAMVNDVNETQSRHIVTIEDPIEFIHADKRSCVSQREVGIDTTSFSSALRAALRQDPDVILLGEIRDEATMEIALQAAETGHMVLSTMHTPDVSRAVHRVLSLSENATELRERIADCLQGVIAQRLVNKVGGGRVAACEVLVVTGTVRDAIKRPENAPSLKELMERGVTPYGMQTFQMALAQLARRGLVSKETAKAHQGF